MEHAAQEFALAGLAGVAAAALAWLAANGRRLVPTLRRPDPAETARQLDHGDLDALFRLQARAERMESSAQAAGVALVELCFFCSGDEQPHSHA